MYFALNNLSGSAFKLYMYFAKNQNGYCFNLSAADVAAHGIPNSTYYKARKELIERGYLIEESGNRLVFKDVPNEFIF